MISCLTLIQHTHRPLSANDDCRVTACGLLLLEAGSEGLFAGEGEGPTCPHCQAALRAASSITTPAGTPNERVQQLIEEGLTGRSTPDPEVFAAMAPDRSRGLPLTRGSLLRLPAIAARLQELFPGWSAKVTELFGRGPQIFVEYRVEGKDSFGLVGGTGEAMDLPQSAVFYIANESIAGVKPLQDAFDIWTALARADATPQAQGLR